MFHKQFEGIESLTQKLLQFTIINQYREGITDIDSYAG